MTRRHFSLIERLRIETHAVWLAARDSRVRWPVRWLGLLIAAYALSPIDLVPDFIPVLGLLDDAILIPAGIWLFVKLLPPGLIDEHRATARAAAKRPRSAAGAILVILIWIGVAWLAWLLLSWAYA
ncbi:MAG: YkvA family protein [Sphingosinicella sp.]